VPELKITNVSLKEPVKNAYDGLTGGGRQYVRHNAVLRKSQMKLEPG
jgi:hypothetical protein